MVETCAIQSYEIHAKDVEGTPWKQIVAKEVEKGGVKKCVVDDSKESSYCYFILWVFLNYLCYFQSNACVVGTQINNLVEVPFLCNHRLCFGYNNTNVQLL